ncbi:hypothetical protein DID80_08005, partial [Candidatus Marinamargulisbacteria bacterium SCGC AAA071-K20]
MKPKKNIDISSSKEPIVEIEEIHPKKARLFLINVSISVLIFSLAIMFFSYWSNPWGYFGEIGNFVGYNDRLGKCNYLKTLKKEELPEAYLLGSSDMMPFQPEQIQSLFNLKTFNLGTFWGRMEEIWSWVNFTIYDLNAPPKLIIIGLEPWTFSVDQSGPPLLNSYRRRFITAPDLIKYAPDYSPERLFLSKYLDLISAMNIKVFFKRLLANGL